MTKKELLKELEALGVEGYSMKNNKPELEAVLAARQAVLAAARKAPPGGGYS